MPVGSHCLFTATIPLAEPSSTYPTFIDFNTTWSEIRDPDNVYSINSGNIRVAEAGRYLVTVGLHTNTTGESLAIHTRCRQNTTVIKKSYVVGNARQTANANIFTKSEFMINLAINDDIDVQWAKKETSTGLLVPADTYIQLVRLTDDTVTAYASYSDGTDTAGYDSATPAPAPFDVIDEETDTDVIQRHATNDDEFLLKGVIGDRFLVLASVYFEGGTFNEERSLNATLDGAQINGVGSQFFVGNSDISDGSLNVSFIVTKKSESDETLRITLENPLGTTTTPVRAINQSGLHIMKLLPTTEIAMFHDATGGEAVEGITQLLNVWNNEDERDAASFVRTDADALTIQKTGTYICDSNVYGDRNANLLRGNYMGRFLVNGVSAIEGNHGCYGLSVSRTGFNILGILEINAAQSLEVQTIDVGGNGSDIGTIADRTGAWVINADTLVKIVEVSVNDVISIIDTPKIENEVTRTDTFSNGESVILDKGFVVSESFLSSDTQIAVQSLTQADFFSLNTNLISNISHIQSVLFSIVPKLIISKPVFVLDNLSVAQQIIAGKTIIIIHSISKTTQIIVTKALNLLEALSSTNKLIIEKNLFLSDITSNAISIILAKSLTLSDILTHSMNIIVGRAVNVPDTFSISSLIRIIKSLKILDVFSLSKQTVVPVSDSANPGGWSDVEFGNNDGFLFDELDEIPEDDNTAVSLDNPAIPENYFEVNVNSIDDPLQSHGHKILFRAKGGGSTKAKVEIYQGITLIATTPEFILQLGFNTFEYYLSDAESITDYSSLKLRVIPLSQ